MKANITARRVDGMKPGESIADSRGPRLDRALSAERCGDLRLSLPRRRGQAALSRDRRPRRRRRHLDKARTMAKKRAAHAAGGARPIPGEQSGRASLNDVLDRYIDRRCAKFRTARQVTSMFDRLVRPALGK